MGWFHELHRHPEIGFQEIKTSECVVARLRELGLDPVASIAGTGVVASLDGTLGAGRTIGLRAELDALPMYEHSGLPYASHIADRAPACGHDGHTTTLLAVAAYLVRLGSRRPTGDCIDFARDPVGQMGRTV